MWLQLLLEQQICSDENLYQKLPSRLDWLGGSDIKKCTYNTLRKLMDDKVAVNCNWAGHKGKKAFKNSQLCTIATNLTESSTAKTGLNQHKPRWLTQMCSMSREAMQLTWKKVEVKMKTRRKILNWKPES
ncbi:unnamed protein product [Allacma fusca]|uniref:DUF4806 domain-containing protein n=1 Tax=Allacma fusca TaxID=39272 RepID=A0A8J2PFJ2_9HEXA|nr:unnamed protein product [Allacma fusca]